MFPMEWVLTMRSIKGVIQSIQRNKSPNPPQFPVYSNTTPLTTTIGNMSGNELRANFEITELNIIDDWKPVILKCLEMGLTPEAMMDNLKSESNYWQQNQQTTNPKGQNGSSSFSNQPDRRNKAKQTNEKRSIIAEFDVKVNLLDVPDGFCLEPRINNLDVSTNYTSGMNRVESKFRTILIASEATEETGSLVPLTPDYDMLDETIKIIETDQSDSTSDQNKKQRLDFNPYNNNLNDETNERNILLLGETGAGKSTTINAFANYLKYGSFEQAKAGKFTQLIPSKFFLTHPTTENEIEIKSGEDVNECHQKEGESCTQSPVGYLFKYGHNQTIRIIDTPGMGDTRGVEVDRENFEQIMQFINHFKNLHGICILIPANETRKRSSFRYCITELLANLHKSACKNIFFCFTFARYTNYGAGDGYSLLESFLHNELHETGLYLSPGVNCFFIDNEAYRYLAAKRQFRFDQDEVEKFDESWTKSSTNTKSMIDKIIRLEPHDIELTRLLNQTQKITTLLAEPLVLLQQNLYYNQREVENHIETLQALNNSRKPQNHQIQVYIHCLELENLEYAKTVCTESRCVKPVDYKVKDLSCHGVCTEIETQNGIVGSSQLKKCRKMKLDGSCMKCGCNWRKHMRLTTEYKQVTKAIKKQHVQVQSWHADSPNSVSKVLETLNTIRMYYQNKLSELENICAKLGYLVEKNSNTSFNKFIEPFLDKLIDQESKKMINLPNSSSNYSDEMMQLWMHMKISHTQRVQELADKIHSNTAADIKLKLISNFCDKLMQFVPLNQVLLNYNNYQEKESKEFKLREIIFRN